MGADALERKKRLAAHFGAIAASYDELSFLSVTARRLVERANLFPGMSALDLAGGTGSVSLLAAERIGANGTLTGVDISLEMTKTARRKLARLPHAHALVGDAEALPFPAFAFDAVLCASSLFFLPDIPRALKEARRVLKPNGFILFNSFAPGFLQPLRRLWNERLQKHGIKLGSLPIHRLPDAQTCAALLREAGFSRIEAQAEQLGYFYPSPEDRWREIAAGLEGALLKEMPNEEREQIRAEHLDELRSALTPQGIFADVPALFAFGQP